MQVLLLSRYSRLGASTRLRTLQYLPFLQHEGVRVEHAPFFDDNYLTALYAGQLTKRAMLGYSVKRLAALRRRPRPDLIWLEYEALPWLPWVVEHLLLPPDVAVVTDYDDAVFHRYDQHRMPVVRWLLGNKIDRVMGASQLVMAGNGYLADRARDAGAARVTIVPTVVDTQSYRVRPRPARNVNVRIGWIGSPTTWRAYMEPLMPLLCDVSAHHGARLIAVGAGQATAAHPLLDSLPWSEDTEVARIQDMDIGIMPLSDTPWARGKCGYKLIQYMACGLPVVASPVGVNADIVEHGVNGFLASTETEWRIALGRLLDDPDLRHRMGAEGRRKVEREYALQAWGPKVAVMLRAAVVRARTA